MINPKQLFGMNHTRKYWYYNINQEQQWNNYSFFPSVHDLHQLELVKQQEQQLLFIAEPEDTLFFRHQPEEEFMDYLSEEGVNIPKILPWGDVHRIAFKDTDPSLLIPYIVSEELSSYHSDKSSIKLFGSDINLIKRINNKFETRRLAESHGFQVTKGFFCNSSEALRCAYKNLRDQGFKNMVIKIPYGSSGKGLKVIDSEKSLEMIIGFISRRNHSFELLLEGWHPVRNNLNCQLWIDREKVLVLAITEQKIDANGMYLGTNFTPRHDSGIIQQYSDEILRLGSILRDLGYNGLCGVDSIIGEDDILYPIIEINARFTQVTYILPMVDYLSHDYSYVISSFINLGSEHRYRFNEVYTMLKQRLRPDTSNHFLIYTFASYTIPDDNKTIYRIFILFYGNNQEKIQCMMDCLHKLHGTQIHPDEVQ
ncbi:ATP-grasp domain-containing protein [Paenibacillus pinisoli]|uniref:ATP-grasp domain-containing protein n=1 Tax=Paenibacillus pinisoli TaxID=1276110 RepID=A0A3A6PBG4_9BACL|nr:ATP-grasp domain-containing protein [Paenibacillus pinisoli]RJX37515.1 ATP-grasp domain-containing protein [Paenibacillus pinisoli]